MLTAAAIGIFLLQGAILVTDELVYHRRRGLPRWERIGHPLDTLTVLIPLALALLLPPEPPWIGAFVALAVFSGLFVTKDEWVHAQHCTGGEQGLHALLFLLHPLLFLAAHHLWTQGQHGWLALEATLVGGFLLYQIFAWNLPGGGRERSGGGGGPPVRAAGEPAARRAEEILR